MNIAVLGSGGWGTALALVLLKNHHTVTLYSHTEEESEVLRRTRQNPLLPGVSLPEALHCRAGFQGLEAAQLVVVAVPSFAVRQTAAQIRSLLHPEAVLVSVSKGIEKGTHLRLSEVIREETGGRFPVAVLMGPSHAEEVARGLATGCVAASLQREVAEFVQDAFWCEGFRVYTGSDIIGVEIGAALKNVMALCAGICVGKGFADNTKALLMTRGLAEMARLGVALGGRRETFAGLTGMGDLIVTCTSLNSRNNRAGICLGQGDSIDLAMQKVGAVVEGYYAVEAAHSLAKDMGVDMPITEAAYRVLYEGADLDSIFRELMLREKGREWREDW